MSNETYGGLKTRTDVLNHLADTFGLKRYLEIGLQRPQQNFDKIRCEYKVSVDPDIQAAATFWLTSDEYFEIIADSKPVFDLIFIDGLHEAHQVRKDFVNATMALSPGGFIVLHDCNPLQEWHTIVPRPTERGHWNGDCYKVACEINQAIKQTVDIDNGCCVVQPSRGPSLFSAITTADWATFDKHRKELLNLVTWDEFISSTVPHVQ